MKKLYFERSDGRWNLYHDVNGVMIPLGWRKTFSEVCEYAKRMGMELRLLA